MFVTFAWMALKGQTNETMFFSSQLFKDPLTEIEMSEANISSLKTGNSPED